MTVKCLPGMLRACNLITVLALIAATAFIFGVDVCVRGLLPLRRGWWVGGYDPAAASTYQALHVPGPNVG